MPQLDVATYPSQIFWLAITFVALYLILWKAGLPRIAEILESRQTRIDQDLERASGLKSEAETVLETYESGLRETRAKAQEELRAAARAASEEATRAHESLGRELASQTAGAEAAIERARAEALQNITDLASDLARAVADRLAGSPPDAGVLARAVETAVKERSA